MGGNSSSPSSSSTPSSPPSPTSQPANNAGPTKVHPIPSNEGWYWQENDGSWHPFDEKDSPISSSQIDKVRSNNPKAPVSFNCHGCSYTIDLSTMIQTNTTTKRQRQVIRIYPLNPTAAATPSAKAVKITYYVWFWEDDDGKWHPFRSDLSKAIEQQFQSDPNACVQVGHGGYTYEIDLKNTTQTNMMSNKKRRIKRVQPVLQAMKGSQAHSDYLWTWEDDNGIWQKFKSSSGSISSEAIEYNHSKAAAIQFHFNSFSYLIDFKAMTQLNETTGKVRKIRRTHLPRVDVYPNTWHISSTNNKKVDMIACSATSVEYKTVSQLFNKTMPGVPLVSVKRIQNYDLYDRYRVCEKQLEKKRGKNDGVRRLFHGTRKQHLDPICKEGFDFRLNGTSVGTVYGKGSYFARDAVYSNKFTDCKTMFIALVLVGDFAVGNAAFVRPPKKSTGDYYDTCVDNVADPSIFVAFDCAHSYPEYLLEY